LAGVLRAVTELSASFWAPGRGAYQIIDWKIHHIPEKFEQYTNCQC
jgi:hypothetical protein